MEPAAKNKKPWKENDPKKPSAEEVQTPKHLPARKLVWCMPARPWHRDRPHERETRWNYMFVGPNDSLARRGRACWRSWCDVHQGAAERLNHRVAPGDGGASSGVIDRPGHKVRGRAAVSDEVGHMVALECHMTDSCLSTLR